MAQVVFIESFNEDILVCGVCKLVFNALDCFVEHKRSRCGAVLETNIISENTLHSLPISNEPVKSEAPIVDSTSSEQINNVYLNETPSNNPLNRDTSNFLCQICKKTFKKRKNYAAHVKTHNENAYQCSICGRCFTQNSHLQRHILSHRVWPDGLSETTPKSTDVDLLSYTCSYCNLITLANYSQFRVHLENHTSLKKFKCIQANCTSLFDEMEALLGHVSQEHDCPVYACHICTEVFNSLQSIAIHHQIHMKAGHQINQKVYKCSQCDSVFKKPEKLSLHLLTESHRKACIHCSKVFASDKRLRLHLQIHRNEKLFKCNICESSFHVKKYLTSHMLKHGKNSFICNVCDNQFKRKDLLQRHMKLHQAKKLFKCPFRVSLECKKEYSRKDKLNSHIKKHTKQSTYLKQCIK